MALDFGILQPANISGQLQAGQESAMRNQLAQQQLAAGQQQMETGRMQQEKAGLELQQFKRRQAGLDRWLGEAEKGGQTGDPEVLAESFYKFAREQGDPQLLMSAQQVLMAAKERKQYLSERMPKAPAVAAPAGSEDRLGDFISQIEAKQNAPMAMPAVTGRPITSEVAAAPAANMLAPAPALAAVAPANALAGPDTKALENEIFRLETQFANVPEAQKEAARLKERLKEFYTPRVVGNSLIVGNKPVYTAPPTQTDLRKNFEFAKTPEGGNYKGTFDQFKAISAPKTTITMSTEKKYGEQFAGKIADSDSNKLGAAEKAPQLAESANRIIDLVSQGNLFTGPIADVKLNIARALNVVGANNNEKIANTEALIAATGQSTLDAIKGAGLGTGQGFTDKDLKFLQGIAGGAITYTPQTLTELATLQHRVATRSVENWNRRFKEIPKSATEGLGIQAVPNVPPLSSGAKAAAARPAGVGVDWTFERDATGNRAWVSPDRKSFKEAQ